MQILLRETYGGTFNFTFSCFVFLSLFLSAYFYFYVFFNLLNFIIFRKIFGLLHCGMILWKIKRFNTRQRLIRLIRHEKTLQIRRCSLDVPEASHSLVQTFISRTRNFISTESNNLYFCCFANIRNDFTQIAFPRELPLCRADYRLSTTLNTLAPSSRVNLYLPPPPALQS